MRWEERQEVLADRAVRVRGYRQRRRVRKVMRRRILMVGEVQKIWVLGMGCYEICSWGAFGRRVYLLREPSRE